MNRQPTTGSIREQSDYGGRSKAHWWRLAGGLVVFAVVVAVAVVLVIYYVHKRKGYCQVNQNCKGTMVCKSGSCVESQCKTPEDAKVCNGFCQYEGATLKCSCDGKAFAAAGSATKDNPYCPIQGIVKPPVDEHMKKKYLIYGSIVGGVLLVLIAGVSAMMMSHKKKRRPYRDVGFNDDASSTSSPSVVSAEDFDPSEFATP
jgi:flagellar basal body-associated protein FliL